MLRKLISFDNTSNQALIFNGGQYGYAESYSNLISPGRTGTYCMAQNGFGNPRWSVIQFSDNQPTWTVGCAFQSGNPGQNSDVLQVCDGSVTGPSNAQTTVQFACGINANFGVYARYNGGILASANGLWRPGSWNYIEVSGTCGTSTTLIVRLNGVVVVTATAVNTKTTGNAYADLVCLSTINVGYNFDDVYILDGQVAAHGNANNTFWGDIAVLVNFPSGNGHYTAWTPTAGANYACVNQYAYTDATYVATATAASIDSYTFPATTGTSGSILGVQENVISRKDSGGSNVIAPFYRGASTDYPQTTQEMNLTNTYQAAQAEFDYDPATNLAWTQSGLNAGEFGQKLIS